MNVYVGELRPIAPSYLGQLLELFLNLLVALSLSLDATHVERLSSTLADDHQIPRMVSTQIMAWFGEITEGKWKVDVESVMKEVGLGILRQHKVRCRVGMSSHNGQLIFFQDEPIEKDILLAKWKTLVGDTFESFVSLSLLSVSSFKQSASIVVVLIAHASGKLPCITERHRYADLLPRFLPSS